MKAVEIKKTGGSEVLELKDITLDKPGPDQVTIEQKAIGLNYIDTYHRSGLYPLKLPSGLGLEGAGIITDIGKNVKEFKVGDKINLERAMILGARLDGHIVQGHVDQTAVCTNVIEEDGSWVFSFEYDSSLNNITIEKGSITVNGTSLTVVNSKDNSFSVAIIPYTYEFTNFHTFKKGTVVNLEFDVIGKYVAKLLNK